MSGNKISLDALTGWWENPFSKHGVNLLYVKGKNVFIQSTRIGDTLELKSGRKLTLGKYSGVITSDGQEISWDSGSAKIVWTRLGELPDVHDPETQQGRFKYTALLGKGANGIVCEAMDMHALRRRVAVKVLRICPGHSTTREITKSAVRLHCEYAWSRMLLHNTKHQQYNPEQASLFLQYFEDHTGLPQASEASLVAPDLLKQLEASLDVVPLPYVLMELAKGGDSWNTLFDEGKEGSTPATIHDKCEIIRQLASALEYLGKFQLLHHDLQFHNMFLSRTAGHFTAGHLAVSIGDFGMMSHRVQQVLFAPYEEEGWKMRDWVPWEAWNVSSKQRGKRASSPAAHVATQRQPAQGFDSHWQAFDVFSLGVIHLYLCLGQVETRRILDSIREGRGDAVTVAHAESLHSLILDANLALRMVSKDPNERPTPAEILQSLPKTGPMWSIFNFLSRSCSRAVGSRSRSPRRSTFAGPRSDVLPSPSRSTAPDDVASPSCSRRQAAKRSIYLPMELNGVRVLLKEADNKWQATTQNFKVKPNTVGLGHRKSKNLDDRLDGPKAIVKWGDSIRGVDAGNGWVRCEVDLHAPANSSSDLALDDGLHWHYWLFERMVAE